MTFIKKTIEDRFWEKVDRSGIITNCWIWVGPLSSKRYGNFWSDNKQIYSHRFSYELFKGKIPKDLEIDHLCKNTKCVNPDHLELVTHKENMNRSNNRGKIKTHCPQGHPYSGNNLYINPNNGDRLCRTCQRKRTFKPRKNNG